MSASIFDSVMFTQKKINIQLPISHGSRFILPVRIMFLLPGLSRLNLMLYLWFEKAGITC